VKTAKTILNRNIATFRFSGRKATLTDIFKLQIKLTFRKISIIYGKDCS